MSNVKIFCIVELSQCSLERGDHALNTEQLNFDEQLTAEANRGQLRQFEAS